MMICRNPHWYCGPRSTPGVPGYLLRGRLCMGKYRLLENLHLSRYFTDYHFRGDSFSFIKFINN